MSLGKVKPGGRIAAVGAIVLLASMLAFDWYGTVVGGGRNAFDHPGFLGGIADVIIVIACVIAIGAAVLAASSRAPGLPVAMSVMTTLFGGVAAVLVFARMIFQPGPDQFIELKVWVFVGLFAAGAIAYGGWINMRDEARREGPARPPSPAPPAP